MANEEGAMSRNATGLRSAGDQEVQMTRVLILALTLLLVPFHLPAQTGPALSKEGSAELSRYLKEMVDGGRVPGLVALVVSPDRVLYQEAFGQLDVARNMPMP